jgi:hypothetical protein
MSVLTTRNELLTASGLDWVHIVDVSDTSSSPQGTSKKIKLDNLFANYLGFDYRYYTKTEVNNFYSGVTNIAGYNKNQWDSALTPDENGDYTIDGDLTLNGNTYSQDIFVNGFVDAQIELVSRDDVTAYHNLVSLNGELFLNGVRIFNSDLTENQGHMNLESGTGGFTFSIPTFGDVMTIDTGGNVVANSFQGDGTNLTGVELLSNKGQANGYVPLNGSSLIEAVYLPSYVDDVLEYADFASFPLTGETGKIYIDLDQNDIYRWSGSVYVEVAGTAPTNWGSITGTLLNQTDLQTALNGKVDVSGDTMTGTLTVPQLEMNQSANYFQPTTNDDKILFIGGNGSGVRDWSNIFFYTGGVFRMNGEDIVTMSENTGRVNQGNIEFNGVVTATGSESFKSIGTGTGNSNIVYNGFYTSDGSTRQGYIGFPSGTNGDLLLKNDISGQNIALIGLGGNNGLRFYDGTSTKTVWHSGNSFTMSGDEAIFSGYVRLGTNERLILNNKMKFESGTQSVLDIVDSDFIIRDWDRDGTDLATARFTFGRTTGNLTATGNVIADDFIQSSDERLKSNIQPLESKPIKADWKSFEMKDRKRVGVIAQELEQNHPEFVHTNEEGYKAVSYIDLLVAKIHELENRIKQLEG